jgi:hypothetical protein
MNDYELQRVSTLAARIGEVGNDFRRLGLVVAERLGSDDHEDVVALRDIAASLQGMNVVIDKGVARLRAALPPEAR